MTLRSPAERLSRDFQCLADPVMPFPDGGEFFCVVSPENIYGPYLTEAAAQSLLDEGVEGRVKRMQLS